MPAPRAQEAVYRKCVRPAVLRHASRGTPRRRLTEHRLDLWDVPYGSPASDTVALVVAELAANSVLHGRVPGRDFELCLKYDRAAGVVRVEVSDTHPRHPKLSASDTEGGRGLLLVEAVAARWGVDGRTGAGKTVWAKCALPGGA